MLEVLKIYDSDENSFEPNFNQDSQGKHLITVPCQVMSTYIFMKTGLFKIIFTKK